MLSDLLRLAIQRLLDDPDLRHRLGGAARQHVSEHFAFNSMLDKMEAIFANVVNRRG